MGPFPSSLLSLLPPSFFTSFIPFFQAGTGNPDTNFDVPITHMCVSGPCVHHLLPGGFSF